MYNYQGKVIEIIDGDTLDIQVDLGFHISITQRFRVNGINTPEVKGIEKEKGLKAKAVVQKLLPPGSQVTVTTYKDKTEKYGRYLADIFFEVDGVEQELGPLLISEGMAVEYHGGART